MISKIEDKVINTLRILSNDMVEKANSGHPGMPLGCAPLIYVLFCKIMNYNPDDPTWLLRDRFVLSNGHGCALLYSILYLTGYNYTIEDLQNFRQLHSKTPGHPEYNPLLGIETSTGPLGQGIANGVGMAIASKKMNIENTIYVLCGDGCLMEGVSYEACSLAGHLGLNNLVLLYDDNGITIDGTTDITFTENVRERFTAFQWNVLEVENGDNDIDDIYNKISIAKESSMKPTIIFVKTTIGFGSKKSGKSSSHGAPLGAENTILLKKHFGFNEEKSFFIDNDVKEYFTNLKNSCIIKYEEINRKYNIENDTEHNINQVNLSIKETVQKISEIKNGEKSFATRDISNTFLNILAKNIPNMIVGSADLGESNKTLIESDFIKSSSFSGQYLHYGIREHAMISIANGISTYDIIPVVSTFLVFITYCLAPIRMAALSKHRVIYVFTHDSFLLGEDGPTHQPIESLSVLRSIPGLLTIRPCDTNEVSGAYQVALENNGPTALILTRQLIPNIENSSSINLKRGGYTVYEPVGIPELIIMATGSEVSLALDVIKEIGDGIKIRLVSMPCCELFDKQDSEYKENILPKNIKKISIEAGGTNMWYKYADYTYGIDRFGESGKMNDLKEYFGFTVQKCKAFILNEI
jgi:transketolase